MIEIALTALSLALVQDADEDPWARVDGEWRRSFTCTVDDTAYFRMDGRARETQFCLNEGDTVRLTLHDHDDGFRGITLSPPEGVAAMRRSQPHGYSGGRRGVSGLIQHPPRPGARLTLCIARIVNRAGVQRETTAADTAIQPLPHAGQRRDLIVNPASDSSGNLRPI